MHDLCLFFFFFPLAVLLRCVSSWGFAGEGLAPPRAVGTRGVGWGARPPLPLFSCLHPKFLIADAPVCPQLLWRNRVINGFLVRGR